MKVFRVGILDLYNGAPNEGMRCIRALISEFQQKNNLPLSFQVFDVRANHTLPQPTDFEVYLSTGGPGSPLIEGADWEQKYFEFIDNLLAHNLQNPENRRHLLAICHSFQLLFQHFDLGIINKRKSTSFGVMPVHKTPDGEFENIFEGLENPFHAVDSRDYQALQPNMENFERLGAKILCLEKERPHIPLERAIMAVRFTPEIIGTQFHPEADAEGMHRYFQTEEKKQAVIESYGERKYYEMIAHLEDPDKIMFTESVVIPRFLETAFTEIFEPELKN